MATSFATELREGYLSVEGSLSPQELALVKRARDLINVSAPGRNRLLAQIVCAYRIGPRHVWGPVILDLLAPALIEMLQDFRLEPPAIDDEEEIRQQLVYEVLRAAARIRLLENGHLTRFRIKSRALTGMLRWLAREGRRQRRQVSYEALEDAE
jgi:hypothetical protein